MTQLTKYDAACKAIAEAKAVDEVKNIRDQAVAMKAYAKQAKNKQLELDAAEIRFRAERRIGQMIEEQRKAGMLNEGAKGTGSNQYQVRDKNKPAPPTLEQVGIDKNLAHRARTYAAIPDDEFEHRMSDYRARVQQEGAKVKNELITSGKAHVANNSGENEWYTPPEFTDAARAVMGSIDLDPASSALANKSVQAEKYFTKKDNGLNKKWHGNVWLNPPYAQPLISEFCSAVSLKYENKEISQACILVNNATETDWFEALYESCSAICFIHGRVKFIDKQGNPSGAPLQGQAIIYLGNRVKTFVKNFEQFGLIMVPA